MKLEIVWLTFLFGLFGLFQELDFRNTLEESARIERQYKQYFDLIIVNDNIDAAYDKLRRAIEALSTEAQWVPVTWVYWNQGHIGCLWLGSIETSPPPPHSPEIWTDY